MLLASSLQSMFGEGISAWEVRLDQKFRKTALWIRTLEERQGPDPDKDSRARLRTAFLSMRERISPLAAQVHQDCDGLTVHDVTHLDALWETADKIIGNDYQMNPVEGFVFGAALLIHDAGMAIAAYPNRMKDIRETKEWRDAVSARLRRAGHPITDEAIAEPPSTILRGAIFHVLRALHAMQAEHLMKMIWGGGSERFHLLDDVDLRQFYGPRVGRIAHSHHWNLDEIGSGLQREVAVMIGLNPDWLLNEIKVSCILRCADAAHIDSRRAPRMLYAIKAPEGTSEDHWRFQNKLAQIAKVEDQIVYSSTDFELEDAPAWWLCYDVAGLVDRELRGSSQLLQENSTQPFAVKGVRGSQAPRLFARDVRVSGWEPVDAGIKVTDPVHLAMTLGGEKLYGKGFRAPLREILQNCVDAVHARRGRRTIQGFPGRIRIILEELPAAGTWIHFDDDGIGMPERVLTGPLIDFGKTIWDSPILSEQYPDVDVAALKPIGQFGIGFFSIFLLGREVRVASRRHDASVASTRVLEFLGATGRPTLRRAKLGELPEGYSTRVSARFDNERSASPLSKGDEGTDMIAYLKHVSAGIDVAIEVDDRIGSRSYKHDPQWLTVSGETFLRELLAMQPKEVLKSITQHYAHRLRIIQGKDNSVFGRAALRFSEVFSTRRYLRRSGNAYVSVEGIAYAGADEFYVGLLSGAVPNATRREAELRVPQHLLAEWATEQACTTEKHKYDLFTLVSAAQQVRRLGGCARDLPLCFVGGRFMPEQHLRTLVRSLDSIHILALERPGARRLAWFALEDLSPRYLMGELTPNIFVANTESNIIFDDNRESRDGEDMPFTFDESAFHDRDGGVDVLIDLAKEEWGNFSALTIQRQQVFRGDYYVAPPLSVVVTLSRA